MAVVQPVRCDLCNGASSVVATSNAQLRCAFNSGYVCNMETCAGTSRMADIARVPRAAEYMAEALAEMGEYA
jgi:hypothetical protein